MQNELIDIIDPIIDGDEFTFTLVFKEKIHGFWFSKFLPRSEKNDLYDVNPRYIENKIVITTHSNIPLNSSCIAIKNCIHQANIDTNSKQQEIDKLMGMFRERLLSK